MAYCVSITKAGSPSVLKIPYAAILVSSNWAAGREPGDSSKALDHSEVSATAETKLGPVIECIKAFTQ